MSTNFAEILSRPVGSNERPKQLPPGTYTGVLHRYETGESSKKKTPFIRLFFVALQPHDDVEPVEFAEVKKKEIAKDFYMSEDAAYMFDEWLERCGASGMSAKEALTAQLSREFTFSIQHRPGQNGGDPRAEIGQFVFD